MCGEEDAESFSDQLDDAIARVKVPFPRHHLTRGERAQMGLSVASRSGPCKSPFAQDVDIAPWSGLGVEVQMEFNRPADPNPRVVFRGVAAEAFQQAFDELAAGGAAVHVGNVPPRGELVRREGIRHAEELPNYRLVIDYRPFNMSSPMQPIRIQGCAHGEASRSRHPDPGVTDSTEARGLPPPGVTFCNRGRHRSVAAASAVLERNSTEQEDDAAGESTSSGSGACRSPFAHSWITGNS